MNPRTQDIQYGLDQFPLWIRLSWTLGARKKLIHKTMRADWTSVDGQGYFRIQVVPPRLNAGQIQVGVSLGKTSFYGMNDSHACFQKYVPCDTHRAKCRTHLIDESAADCPSRH